MKRRHFLAGGLALTGTAPFMAKAWARDVVMTGAQAAAQAGAKPVAASGAATGPSAVPASAGFIQQATELTVNFVSGTLLNFGYSTLNGNQPATYGNRVYLWQVSANSIPWSRPALDSQPILLNQPAGDQNLTNIQISENAYILGFAVGPERTTGSWSAYADVVASSYIPAGAQDMSVQKAAVCSIKPEYVGSNSLVYHFSFLSGFYAKSSGAWVGLWEGAAASYTRPPKWFAPIAIDSSAGTSGLNGLTLNRGSKYTLGLFSGGYNHETNQLNLKRLVCISVFTA